MFSAVHHAAAGNHFEVGVPSNHIKDEFIRLSMKIIANKPMSLCELSLLERTDFAANADRGIFGVSRSDRINRTYEGHQLRQASSLTAVEKNRPDQSIVDPKVR